MFGALTPLTPGGYGSTEVSFDYLLRLLATTPGPGNVAQALRLVSSGKAADRKLDRYAASLLASSQPAEELAVAFTGHATEELRACLIHELVLRGVDITESPGIAGWATSSHWRHHPLGWLPLTLLELEGRPDLPSYSANGGSHSMPYGPPVSREVPRDDRAPVPLVEETTTAATAGAIARGAYGRLAAWQSVAGLSGAAQGCLVEEVEASARACAWYAFGADTKWFERVAWDVGLVAVSPDRRRLALLAATDTD